MESLAWQEIRMRLAADTVFHVSTDEVNPDNILSSRTRQQPVSYNFGSGDFDKYEDSDED